MTVEDLRQIVRRGEDSGVQFKLDVSSPDSLASEVVAFLNAKGGVIYIGVSDAGEIDGLDASGVRRVNQMISNVASQCIRNPSSRNSASRLRELTERTCRSRHFRTARIFQGRFRTCTQARWRF